MTHWEERDDGVVYWAGTDRPVDARMWGWKPPGESEGPPVGSFVLTQIDGWTGRWVSAAQAFVRGGSQWTHAALVVGNGYMVEAQPGGAVLSPLSRLDGRPVLASDDPIRLHLDQTIFPGDLGARERHEARLRKAVADAAMSLVGTPYSFLDYVALAAWEAGIRIGGPLRRYVEDSGHLICSALVDEAYQRAGIRLFEDGRLSGDVTPGDLDRWVQVARWGPGSGLVWPEVDPRTSTLRTTEWQK
jgi:cell wall-associated NlpC family hydrolase